jgi:hypothetical protein
MHLLGRTVWIYEGRTTVFLHRNRGVIVVYFSGRLGHFPRRLYSHLLHRIRAVAFGTNLRVSVQQEGHKNRGADLCTCTGNSGINFEEFGSDFEVETWHSFRDKSI